ncbi:hypothetical protein D3C72_2169850 [compost metagenome]
MQTAHHTPGNFHRHFIAPVRTTDAQPHIVTTQPVIRRFVIDIEELHRLVVLAGQLIQMVTQRINAARFDDKF